MEEIEAILASKEQRLHIIEPDALVIEAVEKMCAARVGALLVMDGKALLGVFSERDLMTRVLLSRRDPAQTMVKHVMTHRTICIGLGVSPRDAMSLMTNRRVRHLPVVRDNRIVGVVSIGDMVRWMLQDREREVEELRGYVAGQYPG
jgi:CBS domain-containing protein